MIQQILWPVAISLRTLSSPVVYAYKLIWVHAVQHQTG